MLDKNKQYDLRYFTDEQVKIVLNNIPKEDKAIILLQDLFYIKSCLANDWNLVLTYHHIWVLSVYNPQLDLITDFTEIQ